MFKEGQADRSAFYDQAPTFTEHDPESLSELVKEAQERPRPLAQIQAARESVEQMNSPALGVPVLPVLSSEQIQELQEQIHHLREESTMVFPAITQGAKTSTNYDSHVTTFSTRTRIVRLAGPEPKTLFVVHNYRSSWIHRSLDGLMKKLVGTHTRKVASAEWKSTFERRSQIPTLSNSDLNTVVMPFVPNMNLYDVFVNRAVIQDFGDCGFVKELKEHDLLSILQKVATKLKNLHEQGIVWGEINLPNIIIDANQEVHICDPETLYDEDVPPLERKARDLWIFIASAATSMRSADSALYQRVVAAILDTYDGKEVVKKLQELVSAPPTLGQRMFFSYLKANLGFQNFEEFLEVRRTIQSFIPKTT